MYDSTETIFTVIVSAVLLVIMVFIGCISYEQGFETGVIARQENRYQAVLAENGIGNKFYKIERIFPDENNN